MTEPTPISATIRQSTSATTTKSSPATALTIAARTFLSALSRCRRLGDADAHDAHQQHALGGAEVAAVDAGQHDRRPDPPGAGDRVARHARARRAASATQAEIRGWKITSTMPSPISDRHDRREGVLGQHQQQHGADDAADQRGDADPQDPRPLADELAAVADHAGHRARAPGRWCWRRWRSPAARRTRAGSGT